MGAKSLKRAALITAVGLTIALAAPSAAVAQDSAGTVRLAVNPWVGYESDYAVVSHLLGELGYTVQRVDLDEFISWQALETGEVDAILEVWGHDAERAEYIDEKGVAQDVGPMGVTGIIGWFVPGWMVEDYPDITDWQSLNGHADLFRTSESDDKGQFLAGDPSYVSNDTALIANLDLDFMQVFTGSEEGLITAFQQATNQRTPLLGYFYDPQWAWSQSPLLEEPLVRVNLPPYEAGCDADPAAVACDYPEYPLYKVVSTTFAQKGGPAYELIKNFSWSNLDQNTVSSYISNEGMTAEEAGARWVEENPDKVAAWMPAT